ncbi:MAG: MmcB family DNA repair protein, partial [Parasphingopyxis sp.]
MADSEAIDSDERLGAADVARGVSRLFYRQALIGQTEVTLGNGRRADIMAIDAKGQ